MYNTSVCQTDMCDMCCFDLFDLQTQEEVYSVQTDPRGVCLIIDCVGTEGGEKSLIWCSL